ADELLDFRRLPASKHRRIKTGDVVALAEERDRRRQGADAIRAALARVTRGGVTRRDRVFADATSCSRSP
ncbi:MAG: hypothetical protein M3063_08840, partial [Actinomycetota bacterium]|nr:hypothetical protein [Actinomycetota bacterium]